MTLIFPIPPPDSRLLNSACRREQSAQDIDNLAFGFLERAAIVDFGNVIFAAHSQRAAGKTCHDILVRLATSSFKAAGEDLRTGRDVDHLQPGERRLESMKHGA